jgi:hypothetical protein
MPDSPACADPPRPPATPWPSPHNLTVRAGGRLDTRFLIMVRGGGRYIAADKSRNLNMGTHVLVHPGGDFTATGCVAMNESMSE